jgi:glyoxylase-like metal-dependent hydrolase (beta-lactamase superfamily II)
MFGNAPRALWQRWAEPDAEGRIALACRCLLLQSDDKLVLFETGVGAFFEPRMRQRFGVNESEHVLLQSLAAAGFGHEAVTHVVLSHLHFDHAGGLLAPYSEGQAAELLFPNARFVVSEQAWQRAQAPHSRDRASFIGPLNNLLTDSQRLCVLPEAGADAGLPDGIRFHFSEGHTPGLMLSELMLADGPLVFAADLIPGRPWVHLPITMGYDRFPERLIDEKRALLAELLARRGRLFFTHDAEVACARLSRNEKGRYTVDEQLEHASGALEMLPLLRA